MTLCLNSFLSLFLLSRLRYEEDCALSAEERREEDEERLVKNWPTFLHNLLIDPLLLRLDPDTRSEPLLEALFGTTPEDVEAPRFSPKLPEPPLAPSAPLPLSGVSTPGQTQAAQHGCPLLAIQGLCGGEGTRNAAPVFLFGCSPIHSRNRLRQEKGL